MDSRDERMFMNVYYKIMPDEGQLPLFMIDGRAYATSMDVRADLNEAWDELQARQIPAEHEVYPIKTQEYTPNIPSWREFKLTLAPSAGGEGAS